MSTTFSAELPLPTTTLDAPPGGSAPALLTVEEAARRLRIGRTLCFRLVSSGELESVVIGRLRRIPPAALDDYVNRLRAVVPLPLPSLERKP